LRVMTPVSMAPTVASTAMATRSQRREGSGRRRSLRRLARLLEVTGKQGREPILAAPDSIGWDS
jgi:hypothetical protein